MGERVPTSGYLTIRYFAGAQAAAGVAEERLADTAPVSLLELADELARRHGPALARVLDAAAFLIDEVPGPRDRVVPTGATVDVLPPFAGG